MFKNVQKTKAYVSMALLLITLIPIMYLGRYNHPTGDDYRYCIQTHQAWEKTNHIIPVLKAAGHTVSEQYLQWQGTYSALFLMSIAPNVFSDGLYHMVTATFLLLLCGSIFYLLKPILCTILQGTPSAWLFISSVLSILCVQTVPSQGETFFWYNGSMYYTGFWAITLFFLGLLIRYLQAPKVHRFILLLLLAVFLAGGNYVSLLPALLITFTIVVWLILKKSKLAWNIGAVFSLFIAGLLVSAAAPGNFVRQAGMSKIPAWKAIIKSLIQGIRYMDAWMGKWWLLAAIIITPVFWSLCKKRPDLHFKYPLVVIGYLYGIFCSMACPLFYTMNSTGPARAVAITYYSFILFSFAAYFYLIGYICKKTECPIENWTPYIYGGIALLLVMQLVSGAFSNCTTTKALRLLITGEANAYEAEYQARVKILEDDSVKSAIFAPYQNTPDMLYVGDLPIGPNDPNSQYIAEYFGKETLYVTEPEQP